MTNQLARGGPTRRSARPNWRGVITVVVATLIIEIVYFLFVRRLLPSWDNRGQFGDLFGAVNALFSGCALGGVAYTLYLQGVQLDQTISDAEQARQDAVLDLAAQRRANCLQLAAILESHYTAAILRAEKAHNSGPRGAANEVDLAYYKIRRDEIKASLEGLHAEVIDVLETV